eukprot:scaffold676_cov135-Alexandrium_tamarense.AAC.2
MIRGRKENNYVQFIPLIRRQWQEDQSHQWDPWLRWQWMNSSSIVVMLFGAKAALLHDMICFNRPTKDRLSGSEMHAREIFLLAGVGVETTPDRPALLHFFYR